MGAPVLANSMEISSKSMGGKSICQFPDVCFTPPQTPATPPGVPIPYPNTGMASDTSEGSRSVKIGGQEVMLKDRSSFKQSTGDEAGSAPKKGMINSKNKGKVYFVAWSMDVKVEGENVVRHLDMTTHNHACSLANGAAPMVHTATMAMKDITSCSKDLQKIKDKCGEDVDPCPKSLSVPVDQQRKGFRRKKGLSRMMQAANQATADAKAGKDGECVQAMRCHLRPYSPNKAKGGCCPGQTPHHIPPKSMMKKVPGYSKSTALCVCLEGKSQHAGSHGENHAALDYVATQKSNKLDSKGMCTVAEYNGICAQAVAAQCGCDPDCIQTQLNDSFTDTQKNKRVKHYQSNSDKLGDTTKQNIDDAYKALKKVTKSK